MNEWRPYCGLKERKDWIKKKEWPGPNACIECRIKPKARGGEKRDKGAGSLRHVRPVTGPDDGRCRQPRGRDLLAGSSSFEALEIKASRTG